MTDILVQLHALPCELVSWARAAVAKFGVHAVVVRQAPFAVGSLSALDRIPSTAFGQEKGLRIYLSLEPLNVGTENLREFEMLNPDSLLVSVGERSKDGLHQSIVSARSDNVVAIKIWRAIARLIRGSTIAGVKAISPKTRSEVLIRSFRYSVGAQEIFQSGAKLYAPAGDSWIEPA